MTRWRLLIDGRADGVRNMAIDRAILDAHEAGEAPPTVRLYRWRQPTVSIGRFQDQTDVDRGYCAAHGIDICRRPTGGRGVLHDDELTYAVVAGTADGVPAGTAASYRWLCAALVEAYRILGVDATLTARARGVQGAGACYLHATPADLSLGAAKLSGSAQVWHRSSVLQHGSLVLTRTVEREAAAFRLGAEEAAALAASTSTIVGALGARPSSAALQSAVIEGFERALGILLEPGVVDKKEAARVEALEPSFVVPE